jgi:Flp pilus assembly protein protease CpaA
VEALTVLRAFSAAAFVCLAAVVTREDVRARRIRNDVLRAGLAACAAAYALQASLTAAGSSGWAGSFLSGRFYWSSLRHLSASLAAGVALWLLDVWPAGDAKLFFVCAAFVPLIRPGLRTFPNYLFLHLLANIFVLPTIFFAARGIFEGFASAWSDPAGARARAAASVRTAAAAALREARRPRELRAAGSAGALFLLQGLLRRTAALQAGALVAQPALLGLVLMLGWEKGGPLLEAPLFGVGAAALAAAALASTAWRDPDAAGRLLRAAVVHSTGFCAVFWAARTVFSRHLAARSAGSATLDELRPGTLLSEETVRLMRRDRSFFREHMEPLRPDGLTAEQVLRVREWFLGLPGGVASVGVARGEAFAPWIFAGALFTLAASRDAASLLAGWLR